MRNRQNRTCPFSTTSGFVEKNGYLGRLEIYLMLILARIFSQPNTLFGRKIFQGMLQILFQEVPLN